MILAFALAPWCGCKSAGDEEPTPDAAPGEATPEEETPKPTRPDDQPLTVDLKLENLSPLYKGFFSHKPFVQQFAKAMSPHVESRAVTLKVVWTEATQVGSIQVLVPDGESTLELVGQGLVDEGPVDPAPLAPYVEALDAYRGEVGRSYDIRVLSFELALELWDPHSESRCLWVVTAGDAEQAELGPRIDCHDPFHKQYELERDGDAWPAPIKGNRKGKKILQGALGH